MIQAPRVIGPMPDPRRAQRIGSEPMPIDADERTQALIRAIFRKAAKARVDPKKFFDFVMREETSRERIECVPHQRVIFDFVTAHDRCVVRAPVGSSKSYSMAALTLHLLGNNPTARGAVISSTQGQAEKIVSLVRDTIEQSVELKAVFPGLRRSSRSGDHWTQTKLVVDRPFGIRDPSVVAVGVHGALPGSRLSWILVDDILSAENTHTPEAREDVRRWFLSSVISRRDVNNANVVVVNSPWNSDDLTYVLARMGWPTLTMSCWGDIQIENAPEFDTPDIRLSTKTITYGKHADIPIGSYRLTEHDSPKYTGVEYPEEKTPPSIDHDDRVPLWPKKFSRAALEKIRADYQENPHEFAQTYECRARSDEDNRVKMDWIERCKQRARDLGYTSLSLTAMGYPAVTGCDLGVGRGRKNDHTSIFTFAVLPNRLRLILDIDFGRWAGSIIINKLIEKHRQYDSIIRVENNAAQDFLRQWLIEREEDIPVRPHTTGANKVDPTNGVESIFIEIENGLWLIPNDNGRCAKGVQRWIDDVTSYQPGAHTGDVLMSSWFAREQARALGLFMRDGG